MHCRRLTRVLLCSAIGSGLGAIAAMANPPKGGSAPAPHAAAPAPHFNAPAAPHFNAPAAPHFAPQTQHFAPQAARPNTMGAQHYGPQQGHPGAEHPGVTHSQRGVEPGRTGTARTEPGREAHNGMRQGMEGRVGGHAQGERPGGRTDEPRGREAGREGGRDGHLAANDPARAHAGFDEHVHNAGRERDIARLHGRDFHVRDARYFNAREWHDWRGGYWHRDFYDGRYGWWFDVGGVYYPYAAPIFPFPLVVASLIVAADMPLVAPPPPSGVPILPALPSVAYHCASPQGFYPTLSSCDSGWSPMAQH